MPPPVKKSVPCVRLQSGRITTRVEFTFRYLSALPEGYAEKPRRRWPLLIFFHGRGERGSNLADLKRHGPPRLIAEGVKLPFVVVAPQCGKQDDWWNYPALEHFVDGIVKRFRIDPARVYLTGLSMGGFAVWALAQHNPRRYAAIAPICGGGDVRLAVNLRDLPVWAFHGSSDKIIPSRRTTSLVRAIRAAGGSPKLSLYRGIGHDSWTKAYNNPALYTWLLAQRRSSPSR